MIAHRLHDQRKLRGTRKWRSSQRWHGDARRLHDQRKLREIRRRSVQFPYRDGDACRLHDQRKFRGNSRRWDLQQRHGDAHRLHDQRKLRGRRRRALQRLPEGDAHRDNHRGQFRSERPQRCRQLPGDAVTGSYNLIGTGHSGGIVNGSQGNIVLTSLTNLGLAPLGDYGGPTETMALLPGSAALGVGTATDYPGTTTPITTDQRGFPVDSPNPDIGAFQGVDLEVESTSGSVDTQPASLTLPGAISLANNLERTTITFDPAVFATPQTITLTGNSLELSNAGWTTSIIGPDAGVTVSGGGQSGVFAGGTQRHRDPLGPDHHGWE